MEEVQTIRTCSFLCIAALFGSFSAASVQAKRTDDGSKLLERYVEARLAEVGGQTQTALSIYQDSLKREPDNILIAGKTYVRAVENGDWQLALKAVRLVELGGSFEKEMPALLFADAFRKQDWSSSKTTLSELENLGNFAFLAPILRNWIEIEKGNPKDVSYRTIEDDRTASYYFDEQRILLLLASERDQEALQPLQDVVEQNTVRMSPIRILAARHYLAENKIEIAKEILTEQRTAAERQLLTMIENGDGRLAAQKVTGDIGAAFTFLRLSADLSTQKADFLSLVMAQVASHIIGKNDFSQLVLGRSYSASNNGEQARAAYQKIDSSSPYFIIARNAEIGSFIGDRQFSEALEQVNDRLSGQPGLPELHILKGQVLLGKSEFKKAESAFQEAVSLATNAEYPKSVLASYYLALGSAQEQAGSWPAGLHSLEKANELLPNSPSILNYLGYAQLERRENTLEAMEAIRQAHKLRSSSAAITDSLGWAYFIAGEHEKAVGYLEKALAGQPQDPTINEHLGDAYWSVGRKYEARYAWKTANLFANEEDRERLLAKIDLGLTPELISP